MAGSSPSPESTPISRSRMQIVGPGHVVWNTPEHSSASGSWTESAGNSSSARINANRRVFIRNLQVQNDPHASNVDASNFVSSSGSSQKVTDSSNADAHESNSPGRVGIMGKDSAAGSPSALAGMMGTNMGDIREDADDEEGDEDGDDPRSPGASPQGAAQVDMGEVFTPASALPSKGSALHASGDCKPCLFLTEFIGCKEGADCSFCHFRHALKSMPRRSKKKRDRFKNLVNKHMTSPEDGEAAQRAAPLQVGLVAPPGAASSSAAAAPGRLDQRGLEHPMPAGLVGAKGARQKMSL